MEHIHSNSSLIEAHLQDHVSFTCTFNTSHPLVSFIWKKDGEQIVNSEGTLNAYTYIHTYIRAPCKHTHTCTGYSVTVDHSNSFSVLTIASVSEAHVGNYTCSVKDALHPLSHSRGLSLTLTTDLYLLGKVLRMQTGEVCRGSMLVLECPVRAGNGNGNGNGNGTVAEVEVRWSREGGVQVVGMGREGEEEVLSESWRAANGSSFLVLQNAVEEMEGIYNCSAFSGGKSVSYDFYVTVIG